MPPDIAVEINMRLPNITVRTPHEPTRVIVNAELRYIKRIQVPALPRPDDSLELSTSGGHRVPVTVKRVDWHEEKALFVVACQYAGRSVPLEVYNSLKEDPEWQEKSLL